MDVRPLFALSITWENEYKGWNEQHSEYVSVYDLLTGRKDKKVGRMIFTLRITT